MPLPEFIYPSNPLIMMACVLLAHLLDYLYPFHSGLLLSIHPVHTSYIMARRLGKPYGSKVRGIIAWFITVVAHLALYTFILYVAWGISVYLWVITASYVMKTSFSLKLLLDVVRNALKCMSNDDWGCARYWVQQIVRRDVYKLDSEHVISAAIESLAESLVDGYISPLFYVVLLGPVGGLLQRIINTMDSALGYKDPEYVDVGWLSAKADTVMNFIPARLTALLIITISPVVGGSIKYSLRVWMKYRRATESVNAGNPISAMAGALRVRLEKPKYYVIGDALEGLSENTVVRALKISVLTSITWFLIVPALITSLKLLT